MTNIRQYKKGDEKELVKLFNEIYGASRDEDYWQWQFMDNPLGESIIVVTEEDSNIIGQCTLVPSKIIVKNEEITSGLSMDAMIKEEFRGKGLFEKMAIESYNIGSSEGIKISTGFPTEAAYKGLFGEIDAKFVADIPLFINIYRIENFLVGIVKLKVLAKILAIPSILIAKFVYREKKIKVKETYEIKAISEFGKEFDLLWDRIKEDAPIMTKRSSEFLNWRIKNHPKIAYKTFAAYLNEDLVGYIILKTEKRKVKENVDLIVGTIIDMIGINDDVIAALYFKAKQYFKSIKVDFVVCWAAESMKYRQLIIDLGFYKIKGGLAFVVKDLFKDGELAEYISKEKNWYLMPIESDVY